MNLIKQFVCAIIFITPLLASAQIVLICPEKSDSPIPNFCNSTKDVLWRGAKPDAQGAAWLANNGVGSIVNLELIYDDLPTFKKAKIEPNINAQVQYHRIRDWEPLVVFAPAKTDNNVAKFLAIMSKTPKPTYVHCRSGQNRTGIMVAAYRVIAENVDPDTAIAEMQSYKGIWFNQDEKYIRSLTPKRRELIKAKALIYEKSVKPSAIIECKNGACNILK
jgi:protein tyrosine phosphatase (PTP) superfamily phosphohydrolase (DUF442 family)